MQTDGFAPCASQSMTQVATGKFPSPRLRWAGRKKLLSQLSLRLRLLSLSIIMRLVLRLIPGDNQRALVAHSELLFALRLDEDHR